MACAVSPARAQPSSAAPAEAPPRVGTWRLATAGAVGGLAGLAVGIAAGRPLDADRCDDCVRWGAVTGAGLGATVGITLGVHLADGRRGRLLPSLVRTGLVMGAFWGASYLAARSDVELDLLLIPAGVAAGVVTAVRTERATASAGR